METALQKAIKIIKALAEEEVLLIARIEALIPLEKEQIENAWADGAETENKRMNYINIDNSADQYYSQTYQSK